MFTGIVEAIGSVAALTPSPTGTTLHLHTPYPSPILSDAQLGDSISINGTCLTITTLEPAQPPFTTATFGLAPETLRRTNLGDLVPGSRVNVERAVLSSTRMGGHFVQGHVDTIATIAEKRTDGEAVVFRLRPRERDVLRYVVVKGYVALDGASLTVTAEGADTQGGWLEVMLVQYSQEKLVMSGKEVGDKVNLEVDMTAKYLEKSLNAYLEGNFVGGMAGEKGVLDTLIDRRVVAKMEEIEAERRGGQKG